MNRLAPWLIALSLFVGDVPIVPTAFAAEPCDNPACMCEVCDCDPCKCVAAAPGVPQASGVPVSVAVERGKFAVLPVDFAATMIVFKPSDPTQLDGRLLAIEGGYAITLGGGVNEADIAFLGGAAPGQPPPVARFVAKLVGAPDEPDNPDVPDDDPDKPDPKPLAWISELKTWTTAEAKKLGRPASESLAVAKCFEPHLAATDFAKASADIRAARAKELGLDAFLVWEPFASSLETYLDRHKASLDATTAPLALKAIHEGLLDAGKSASAIAQAAASAAPSGTWVERTQRVCDPITRTCRYETIREFVPTQP